MVEEPRHQLERPAARARRALAALIAPYISSGADHEEGALALVDDILFRIAGLRRDCLFRAKHGRAIDAWREAAAEVFLQSLKPKVRRKFRDPRKPAQPKRGRPKGAKTLNPSSGSPDRAVRGEPWMPPWLLARARITDAAIADAIVAALAERGLPMPTTVEWGVFCLALVHPEPAEPGEEPTPWLEHPFRVAVGRAVEKRLAREAVVRAVEKRLAREARTVAQMAAVAEVAKAIIRDTRTNH